MEDGTLSFLDIIALEHGFKVFYRLVGSMEDARAHTCFLARYFSRVNKPPGINVKVPFLRLLAGLKFNTIRMS